MDRNNTTLESNHRLVHRWFDRGFFYGFNRSKQAWLEGLILGIGVGIMLSYGMLQFGIWTIK